MILDPEITAVPATAAWTVRVALVALVVADGHRFAVHAGIDDHLDASPCWFSAFALLIAGLDGPEWGLIGAPEFAVGTNIRVYIEIVSLVLDYVGLCARTTSAIARVARKRAKRESFQENAPGTLKASPVVHLRGK